MKHARFGIAGLLLVLTLALAACAGSPAAAPTAAAPPEVTPAETTPAAQPLARNADGYTDISVDQLAQMLEDKNFTLVNVHIPYEGELPATDLFIPYNEIAAHTDELPAQDAPIVLYCRSGSMSAQAAKTLVELGYTNVLELDGGFNAWQAAGRDLAQADQAASMADIAMQWQRLQAQQAGGAPLPAPEVMAQMSLMLGQMQNVMAGLPQSGDAAGAGPQMLGVMQGMASMSQALLRQMQDMPADAAQMQAMTGMLAMMTQTMGMMSQMPSLMAAGMQPALHAAVPLTGTMPMRDTLPMSGTMPMMDDADLTAMMAQMMGMMGQMQGMMGTCAAAAPLTGTMPMSATIPMAGDADLTAMMAQMMGMMGLMQSTLGACAAATAPLTDRCPSPDTRCP